MLYCHKVIWLSELNSTYCMLPQGHSGECGTTEPYKRAEGELIPEGVSYSESTIAYYLYIRNGDIIFTVRVCKPDLHWSNPKRRTREPE